MEIDPERVVLLMIGYPLVTLVVFSIWYFVTGEGQASLVLAFLWPIFLPILFFMWLYELPGKMPGRCNIICNRWCRYGGNKNFGDGMPVIETFGFCRKIDEMTLNIKRCSGMKPVLKPKKPNKKRMRRQ